MAKILLDIFLILLFIAVGGLQIYVILRIKQLQTVYEEFMQSQDKFVRAIEKAKQSLMLVNSQAVDVLPELQKNIELSESLMQDFSFVLARANKKIDVLQEMSVLNEPEEQISENKQQAVKAAQDYNTQAYNSNVYNQMMAQETEFSHDPVLARLEQLEKQEQDIIDRKLTDDNDFLKTDNSRSLHQQELIEKALKEIL